MGDGAGNDAGRGDALHIVQIAPFIGRGSGVAGVAANLETEFRAMGHTVERFTLDDARVRRRRPWPKTAFFRALASLQQAVAFSTVGTVRARRFLAARPAAVSITHNGAMTGDVYVNHGVVFAAMRARGQTLWRMVRNPTHIFTFCRDLIRYRSRIHRAVVALADDEVRVLRRTYGRVQPPIVVIPNGVDLDHFRPPSFQERRDARASFHLDEEDRVVLFIGHEFERKGLAFAIDALVHAPTVLLLVVGGRVNTLADARAHAEQAGVADRVLFVGVRTDLALMFAASDIFVLPSAYESHGLVILEALASGVPVVATRVGCAPDVVEDGVNGFLIDRDPVEIADRLEQLAASDLDAFATRARESAQVHSWRSTAEQYIALLREVAAERVHRGKQLVS